MSDPSTREDHKFSWTITVENCPRGALVIVRPPRDPWARSGPWLDPVPQVVRPYTDA